MNGRYAADQALLEEIFSEESLQLEEQPSAHWLLSDWQSEVWTVWIDRQTRYVDGTLCDAAKINWAHQFPNGEYLTGKRYRTLLQSCRRWAFAIRTGPKSLTESTLSLVAYVGYLFRLLDWMVLEGFDEVSGELSLSDLTPASFDRFCQLLPGGLPAILHIEARFISLVSSLSPRDRDRLISSDEIDYSRLAVLLKEEKSFLTTGRVRALLNRAAGLPSIDDGLHRTANKSMREFWGVDELTYGEISTMPNSTRFAETYLTIWRSLWVFSPHIPGLLSWDPLKETSLQAIANDLGCAPKKRTPSIPEKVAFFYLDNAVRWVVEYGVVLADYYDQVNGELDALVRGHGGSRPDYFAPKAFSLVLQPTVLRPLRIARINRVWPNVSNAHIRENLSVEDAIGILRSACFVVIAAFSARRVSEILQLRRDCIIAGADGWDIRFELRKVGVAGEVEEFVRPVPEIVKTAVDILETISKKLRESIKADDYLRGCLWISSRGQKAVRWTPLSAYKSLDLFADVIRVPLIDGRRWYSRPHQWRRFFAISYFWQNRMDASLSALAWFLGHLDPTMTMRYILEDLRGSELSDLEATFIVDTLRDANAKGFGISKLKAITKEAFNVDDIKVIEADHLQAFIEQMIENGEVSIETASIHTGNGTKTEIFVRVSPCQKVA